METVNFLVDGLGFAIGLLVAYLIYSDKMPFNTKDNKIDKFILVVLYFAISLDYANELVKYFSQYLG